MPAWQRKAFSTPDEVRSFDNGRVDLVTFGGGTVGRFTLQPGWRWSQHVKPIAGTDWCEQAHFGYQIAGRLAIRMKDGSEFETGPGDVSMVPPGHDAWVVGDEPVVLLDWSGAATYAQR